MGKKSRIIMNRNARKQHVISEMHFRHFSDSNGNIYVYEKGKATRKSTPHNECVIKDYFECKLPGYETNFEVENRLGKLETAAAPIYRNLIAGRELTSVQAATWALYVSSLFLRSRKIREELSPGTYANFVSGQLETTTLRDDQWRIFNKFGRLIPLEEIREYKSRLVQTYADPALQQINSMNDSTPNLASALVSRHWQVVRPANGMYFVTSDAPVFTLRLHERGSSVGVGWGYKDTHIGFPLDPQHLFIASPTGVEWVSPIDETNTLAFVGTMAQFSYRHIYAHRDSEDIRAPMERHSGTILFGRDAYTVA